MIDKISQNITTALRQGEKERLLVLRSLKTALRNKEIELMRKLSNEESIIVLQSQVKSRQQAQELYIQGQRKDLADREQAEIEIIMTYLPQPLSETEMEQEVEAAMTALAAHSMKDMGSLMRHLKEKLGSRANGTVLSSIVKKKLTS
ncbi:MAG: GatB/YqeY domain-containing protein [Candidatus Cloacimonetes bacterium]|nr:GatB/YqeY domain-containing protein [Candidatus Cloacimonadota bacterium]